MSDENVEVVRNGFEALREGDVEALLPLIDEDFEVTTPASLAAEPDTARGRTTGLEFDQSAVMVWTVREGKAVGLELFTELDEALGAAGSAEGAEAPR